MKLDKKTKALIRMNLKNIRLYKCLSSFDERLFYTDRKYYPRGNREVCYTKYLKRVRKQKR